MTTAPDPTTFYRPIAPWTGRLILPPLTERRADGGVYLQVENAPTAYAHLIGQRVWLGWHPQSIHQKWLDRATTDIQFDPVTRQSQAKQNVHPERLDRWRRVSPLESLAGARPVDDVQVELDVMAVRHGQDEWTLYINDEPIQIVGVWRALVQFVAPVGGKHYRVRHFDRQSRRFQDTEAIVTLPDAGVILAGQIEQSSALNIEASALNPDGWYIYGEFDAEQMFVVQALEPAAALRLTPTQMAIGRAEAQAHIGDDKWKSMPFRRLEITLIDTNGRIVPRKERPPALRLQRSRELWAKGDEALVIHTFGWRGGDRVTRLPLGFAAGHFAFGLAKLGVDEFTGSLRFDLVYRQVYAHNVHGIISGAHRWHSYMGSLKRGWMYTLPVSDVMVRLPELTVPYRMGDSTFHPLHLIKQELALMEARYRTGGGNGASIVTPVTSCVKDSNQALFAAIAKFRRQVVSNPTVQSWLANHADDYHAQRFWRLESLLNLVEEKVLFPLDYVPRSWRGENDDVAAHRSGDRSSFGTVLEALKTWKTLLPRRAERELLNVFRQAGATMIDYQSALIGGEVPGIVPIAPTILD